ncbi:F-box protein [Arachis hypogaea]|nr:F-box protein [Arachis hypogaea]
MSEVKNKLDLLQRLGPDMSIKVLTHLDPCDLVRVSTLSRSWHQFVIENGLCKHLCLKMFPELSGVRHVIEVENMIEPVSNMLGSSSNWEYLKRNHKVYAFLACGLSPSISRNCISSAVSASSYNKIREENDVNTLDPRDTSYWSSEGKSDPSVPETLEYMLTSKLCLITEIHVQPFQAYSAKAVRFRMGRARYATKLELSEMCELDFFFADKIFGGPQWTYTSPEFAMLQENCLQKFKLLEPVLCIGDVLQVELLGRVQKKEMDQLFYIWLICKSFLLHIHMHTGTPRHKQLCIDNSMLFCLKLLKA